MSRGKGVLLQRYRDGGLTDAVVFRLAEGLSWPTPKGRARSPSRSTGSASAVRPAAPCRTAFRDPTASRASGVLGSGRLAWRDMLTLGAHPRRAHGRRVTGRVLRRWLLCGRGVGHVDEAVIEMMKSTSAAAERSARQPASQSWSDRRHCEPIFAGRHEFAARGRRSMLIRKRRGWSRPRARRHPSICSVSVDA